MKGTPFLCALAAAVATAAPCAAQNFSNYHCDDGTQFAAAFFEGNAYLEIDGQPLKLPQRLAVTGVRYAKGGVTLAIKGQKLTLKRRGQTTDCTAD